MIFVVFFLLMTISPLVPRSLARHLVWLPDSARLNGMHIMGGPGSGKSRLMGRVIAWLDFMRRVPLIMIDPTGGTIANFLDKMVRLPADLQPKLWKRITYVDMSGQGKHIVPFPLYCRRHEHESLDSIAQRYLQTVLRVDPYLATASVEGMNAITRLGTYAGMILAALGYQITEAEDLIRNPERWQSRFQVALAAYPEVKPAVEFFREFMEWPPDLRSRRSDALFIKLMPFNVNPGMAAMFGAAQPTIDWERVVAEKRAVLLDFRHELTPERRRFKLLWVFLSLMEFFKGRGIAGREAPVSFIIDEVTQLLAFRAMEQSIMAEDINELTTVVARNMGVLLTIAHQSLAQIDEGIQTSFMQMGTQIIGVMPNPNDAHNLARQFTQYDPYKEKKREPVWMSVTDPSVIYAVSEPTIIDWRSVEFSADEQLLLTANKFRSLGRFRFLVRVARGEGDTTGPLRPISIENIDRNLYPDLALVSEAARLLMQRDGVLIQDVLAEVAERLKEPVQQKTPSQRTDRIKSDDYYLPLFTQKQDDDFATLREEA